MFYFSISNFWLNSKMLALLIRENHQPEHVIDSYVPTEISTNINLNWFLLPLREQLMNV